MWRIKELKVKYTEKFLLGLARIMPNELKIWVLVVCANKVEKGLAYPGQQTYIQMCKPIEKEQKDKQNDNDKVNITLSTYSI